MLNSKKLLITWLLVARLSLYLVTSKGKFIVFGRIFFCNFRKSNRLSILLE